MAAKRVGPHTGGKQRVDGSPNSIEHFWIERAHDKGRPPLVVGLDRTQHHSWAATATGGWSSSAPIRAASKELSPALNRQVGSGTTPAQLS